LVIFICFSLDTFQGFIKDNEETFDENNIRNFIDAFLLEMLKKTDDSFTVSTDVARNFDWKGPKLKNLVTLV